MNKNGEQKDACSADLPIQLHIKLILLLSLSISDDNVQVLIVYLYVHSLLGHVLCQDGDLYYSLCLKPLVPAVSKA